MQIAGYLTYDGKVEFNTEHISQIKLQATVV